MENLILQKRKMVQSRIEKSFESGLQISELQCIEKAYTVGQSHPKHPDWLWTDLGNGKFDWKSKNGKWWKGKTGNVATPAPASKPTTQKKFDADVTEHVDELVKKIGKDKALERFERYVKEYGDDGTKFGAMMKYKYSQAAEYLKGKAESDFKKTFKDARDEVLQQVVLGKIQASANERKWAKDLLDERKAAEDALVEKKAKSQNITSTDIKDAISGIPAMERLKISGIIRKNDVNSATAIRCLRKSNLSDDGLRNFLLFAEHFANSKEANDVTRSTCKKWADLAKKEMQNRDAASSKIDDTTIDQDAYDKEKSSYIWAGTASVEKDLKTITDDIEASKKSLMKHLNDKNFADLQKDFTEKISRKKALEDILEARKDVEKKKTIGEKIIKKFDDLKGGTWNTPLSDRCNIKVDDDGTMYIRGNNTHYGVKKIIAEIKFKGDEYTFKWGSFADNPRIKKYHSKDDIKNAVESILSSENFKMVKKFKDDGNSFFNELVERVKSATFSGKLSDDARKKLENAIKTDKKSIQQVLKLTFPAATNNGNWSDVNDKKVTLDNGKQLSLKHITYTTQDRIGQEFTHHEYTVYADHKRIASYTSSSGYTTPVEAKKQVINETLLRLFAG